MSSKKSDMIASMLTGIEGIGDGTAYRIIRRLDHPETLPEFVRRFREKREELEDEISYLASWECATIEDKAINLIADRWFLGLKNLREIVEFWADIQLSDVHIDFSARGQTDDIGPHVQAFRTLLGGRAIPAMVFQLMEMHPQIPSPGYEEGEVPIESMEDVWEWFQPLREATEENQ